MRLYTGSFYPLEYMYYLNEKELFQVSKSMTDRRATVNTVREPCVLILPMTGISNVAFGKK